MMIPVFVQAQPSSFPRLNENMSMCSSSAEKAALYSMRREDSGVSQVRWYLFHLIHTQLEINIRCY